VKLTKPRTLDSSEEHEQLVAILETAEILSDPDAMEMLQKSIADIRAGRVYDHNAVEKELG
jgi:hypothetical protein